MKFNKKGPLDWLVLLLGIVGLSLAAEHAHAQTIFNCSSFNGSTSGACSVAPSYPPPATDFWVRGGGAISGSLINFVPTGSTHNGYGLWYKTTAGIQAFSTTFTFVPNGWNFAFVLQNTTSTPGYEGTTFDSGASCEAGFYQDDGVDPTPNNLFAMDFDSSGYLGGSFSYSSVQIYQQHQSPCQPNDGGAHWYSTTKTSTSPVPLTSPVSTQYSTTGDTYSATVTYDGSTVTLNMYDVTAGGSCPGASCFTKSWSNVSIPSLVTASTSYIGFTSGVGSGSPQEPTQYPLNVNSWSFTTNTPTGSPTYTAWNAGSAYSNGTFSAASPVYSLAPGIYSGTQSVSISSSTVGANICYTLASSTPTVYPQVDNNGGCASGTAYSGPIAVSSTSTLYAMAGTAWGTGPPSTLVAGTYTIGSGCLLSSGATVAQIQAALNLAGSNSCGAPNSSTVSFGAGTYIITSALNLPCGVSVTAAVQATPSNVILSAGPIRHSAWIWNIGAGCSNNTISWLSSLHAGFLSVTTPNTNLTVTQNQIGDLPCCNGADAGMTFGDPAQSNFNFLTNATITWNTIGDSTSCLSGPQTLYSANNNTGPNDGTLFNAFAWTGPDNPSGPNTDEGPDGGCVGVNIGTSTNGVIFENNTVIHEAEGVHIVCNNGTVCSPSGQNGPGVIGSGPLTYGLVAKYNWITNFHRIAWEEQAEVTSGLDIEDNVLNAVILPYPGTFMYSMACCANPASTAPYMIESNNVILMDTVPTPQYGVYGYGIEAWGYQPTYANNLIQTSNYTVASNGQQAGPAIAWGFGIQSGNANYQYNTTCGPVFATAGYIVSEGFTGVPSPTLTGNVTVPNCPSSPVSIAPTISPSPGSHSFPLTVTVTDPGYTSSTTTWPLGNTGIWYTTDGTTPVPGSGSAKYLSTGQTFVLTGPATVQAVGMWGAQNQPTSYATGYGFVHSAVVSAAYTSSGGAVTLSSATIAPTGGASTLQVGGTVQMIVTCHYSDGSTSGCNTTDSHGNAVTSWASNSGNATVSSSGLATGAAVGSATITATVTGGITTSPGAVLTVSASPLTLSSISLATTGGVSAITAGSTNQLLTTCHYNDGTSTSCSTMDSHGNAVTAANSSAPTIATVTSPGGLVTGVAAGSTNLSASVIPAPSMLGTSVENVTGATGLNFINEIYGVTGTSAGTYTPGNCHIIIPATTNWVAGKIWTCLLVLGTPTTQNASALCSNSYTMSGTSWPGGDIVISMAGCPALPPDQGYWVGSTTNQSQASPVQGFSNCGSSCSGASPTSGSGTYAYRYVANTFGSYTSLPTTLTASGTPSQQVSQYIELTTTPVNSPNLPLMVNAAPPTLLSAYITGTSSLVVPNTAQMAAKCHYSSGPDQDCTVADINGDAVSAWLTSDATKATVGNVGSAHPGLVTAVAAGTPSITAVINNAMNSTAFPITVTNPVVTLTGVSLSLTGGVTGLFVGATNQLKATCTYSDGSHDDCTTTDVYGNLAHNYASTTPAHATVNATSGLVTGVAPGATTFTAVAGSFTSNALPLNVFPVLSGVYTITVSGPVILSGTVQF